MISREHIKRVKKIEHLHGLGGGGGGGEGQAEQSNGELHLLQWIVLENKNVIIEFKLKVKQNLFIFH